MNIKQRRKNIYSPDEWESPKMSHYEVLDCSPNSSTEELKQAYHRKALKFHPDKSSKSVDGAVKFLEIQKAWEVLGDSKSRKQYDAECQQADLENQYGLIYARLVPTDLELTADEKTLSYNCRCGSEYLIHKSDLVEKNSITHVPCEECTFVIEIET